jgi:hypothetical protein
MSDLAVSRQLSAISQKINRQPFTTFEVKGWLKVDR